MITKRATIDRLSKYIGRYLLELAGKYGTTVFKNGRQNKGWKGLTLERLAGLSNDNKQAPEGLGFELKSVAFKKLKRGDIVPQETMAITMIHPEILGKTSFYDSHCWEKLMSKIMGL